jgi:hypothetical protein
MLISGLTLAAALIRLLRQASWGQRQRNPQEGEEEQAGESPASQEVGDQDSKLKVLLAVVIAGLGIALAAAAWDRFTVSAPPAPSEHFDGVITVFLPEKTDLVDVEIKHALATGEPPLEQGQVNTGMYLTVKMQGARKVQDCIPWVLGLFNQAKLRNLAPSSEVSTAGSPAEGPGVQRVKGRSCSDSKGRHEVSVSGDLSRSFFSVSGFRLSVTTPTVWVVNVPRAELDRDVEHFPVRDESLKTSSPKKWNIVVRLLYLTSQYRRDSGAGRDDRLGVTLQASDRDPERLGVFPQESATMQREYAAYTYLSGEAAGNRSLFIAGVLAGLAGGLLPWAGQLLLDAIPRRRREVTS